jgi:2-oxoglutarate dehydrogenase E1 component
MTSGSANPNEKKFFGNETQMMFAVVIGRNKLLPTTRSAMATAMRPSLSLLSPITTYRSRYLYSTGTTEGFLQGSAAAYVETMYESWKADPKSVHVSWQAYFKNVANGAEPGSAFQAPPTLIPESYIIGDVGTASVTAPVGVSSPEILDHMKVQLLVRAYQVRGHHLANLDPLGITKPNTNPPELKHTHYGFTEKDLDRVFHLGQGMMPGFLDKSSKMTLREIIQSLQDTYCRLNIIIITNNNMIDE